MTNRLWIFPAVFCLLISLTFSEGFLLFGAILAVLWFIRILCLKHRLVLFLSISIGVLFIGVLFHRQKTNVSHFTGEETTLLVYPKSTSIKIDGNNVRFDGVLQDHEIEENVVVQHYFETEAEKMAWLENPPLNHLKIDGLLEKPAKASNFHQFDYRNYLKRKQTYWQIKAENLQEVENDQLSKPSFHRIERFRFSIFNYIDRVFTEEISRYLKTLFFADNRGFSEETLQQYRSLGVIHLFSISGFHISYLVNIIKQLLLRLGITHERTNLFLIIALPLYGWLAGFGVSVFRAVMQNTLSLISKTFKQPMDTLDAWSLTMILALFINPYQIFQVSFQLSYTLSGVFILMGKKRWIRELNVLTYSLLFSGMSGLASLPILTYHFYEIPWVTVLANLMFIPFFTYGLFPALLFLFGLSFVLVHTSIFSFLNKSLTFLILYTEDFLSLLNNTFNFSFVTGRLPGLVLFILVISIFQCLKKIEGRKRPRVLSILVIFLCLFYHQISPVGYVTMLDVGQGDSILIKEPMTQKVTLIDTGGSVQWQEQEEWAERIDPFSIGKDIVTPALKAFGISTIDRLYLTHPDIDHMGEMESIGKELLIKEVAATQETFSDATVLKQLENLQNTELVLMKPPEIVNFPTTDSVTIHPLKKNQSKNDQSLVLYGKMGEDTWLFTGDIEEDAEAQIISDYPNLQVDYLKVAHHGSQTSSTQNFIDHVKPKVALISAGKNNIYGHPDQDVLKRFEEQGISVYSTSENGAIRQRYLKIPGFNYWFSDRQTVHKD